MVSVKIIKVNSGVAVNKRLALSLFKKNVTLITEIFMKKYFVLILLMLLMFSACERSGKKAVVKKPVLLSSTTSTQDSGLFDYLLPLFTSDTGWPINVVAVGSGAALQMGRDGTADVLLVHSKDDEIKFVADGFGIHRFDVMYNDYIIAGPVQSSIAYNKIASETFRAVAAGKLPFISRGDRSGTNTRELSIWKSANINPEANPNYRSVGQGMGATLRMANELNAYTLCDRATWLSAKDISLAIICEHSPELLNYYGVIAINPAVHPQINAEGAKAFIDWILSKRGQELIAAFGVAEFGAPLFTPNAGAN